MKNFILPAMLFIALSASAVNEKIVKSAVKNVTVFTQGAQVFRSSSVSLSTGVTDLVFQGILSQSLSMPFAHQDAAY